jgi:hypothetical protein
MRQARLHDSMIVRSSAEQLVTGEQGVCGGVSMLTLCHIMYYTQVASIMSA